MKINKTALAIYLVMVAALTGGEEKSFYDAFESSMLDSIGLEKDILHRQEKTEFRKFESSSDGLEALQRLSFVDSSKTKEINFPDTTGQLELKNESGHGFIAYWFEDLIVLINTEFHEKGQFDGLIPHEYDELSNVSELKKELEKAPSFRFYRDLFTLSSSDLNENDPVEERVKECVLLILNAILKPATPKDVIYTYESDERSYLYAEPGLSSDEANRAFSWGLLWTQTDPYPIFFMVAHKQGNAELVGKQMEALCRETTIELISNQAGDDNSE